MILGRTQDSLEILKKKPQITVEDALKFFYTFCEDIKSESGVTLEQQDPGNIEEMVKKVRWLGRTAVRTYEKKRGQIQEAASRERLEKINGELEQVGGEEEKAEKTLELLKSREAELKEKREKLEKEQKEGRTLEENCKDLEREITRLQEMDIPLIQKHHQQLQEEK